jgi:hypothetical protein
MITNINELVKDKSDDVRDIFKNVNELEMFINRVLDYEKITDKLKIDLKDMHFQTPTPQSNAFFDQEVEDSLLKGLKI